MTFRSDEYDRIGFKASEIYPFLERHGVVLTRPAESLPAGKATAHIESWMLPLRAMPKFTIWEAACIMANDDPHPPDYGGYGESDPGVAADMRRYKRLLTAAIDDGILQGENWGGDRDYQEIRHADLREWCRKYDQPWPIPELNPQPATNAEVIAEIERLKAEIARYKAELAEAKEGVIYADHPQCAPELDACLTVWRHATKRWLPGEQTPKAAGGCNQRAIPGRPGEAV